MNEALACSGPDPGQEGTGGGHGGQHAPLNMTLKDGQIAGLEVDLARIIADALESSLRSRRSISTNFFRPWKTAG